MGAAYLFKITSSYGSFTIHSLRISTTIILFFKSYSQSSRTTQHPQASRWECGPALSQVCRVTIPSVTERRQLTGTLAVMCSSHLPSLKRVTTIIDADSDPISKNVATQSSFFLCIVFHASITH